MLETLYLIVFLYLSYAVFWNHLYWCSYEPALLCRYGHLGFPEKGPAKFDAVLHLILFLVHAATSQEHPETSAALFWIVVGGIVGPGILPPVPAEEEDEDSSLLRSLMTAFWGSAIGGLIVGAMVWVYVLLVGFIDVFGTGSGGISEQVLGPVGLAILISCWKATVAWGCSEKISDIAIFLEYRKSLKRLYVRAGVASLGILFLFGMSPSASTEDPGTLEHWATAGFATIGYAYEKIRAEIRSRWSKTARRYEP